jgi:hypothetical protein
MDPNPLSKDGAPAMADNPGQGPALLLEVIPQILPGNILTPKVPAALINLWVKPLNDMVPPRQEE